jgi:hypothetical protein
MKDNALFEKFQSAYLEGRGTETALLRVQNDILTSMDSKRVTALLLLDLSAAFDTVNHSILLDGLHTRMGVRGKALDWIKSYLSDRKQIVRIEAASSATFSVKGLY